MFCALGAALLLSCTASMDTGGGGGAGRTGGGGSAGAGGGGAGGIGGGGGGGGGISVSPDYVSGSRLKVRVQTSSDGGKQAVGWYDSMLKINCVFQAAADGQQRCVPQSSATAAPYFAAGCTTKLAGIPTSYASCPPTYAYSSEAATGCTEYNQPAYKTHYYTVGAAYTDTMAYYLSGVNCMSTPVANTGYAFYQVGTEIDPTTFAAGSIVVE
jgi:hypothetical protein